MLRSILKILSWAFLVFAVLTSLTSLPEEHPALLPLPSPFRWFGSVIGFVLLLLLAWTHGTLGRQWSTTVELREDHVLMMSGPYRRVRHPMYSIGVLILVSFFLSSGNCLILPSLVCVIIMIRLRVRREEGM